MMVVMGEKNIPRDISEDITCLGEDRKSRERFPNRQRKEEIDPLTIGERKTRNYM
jgi:hypothetical protein